jgi:hypothetical protein
MFSKPLTIGGLAIVFLCSPVMTPRLHAGGASSTTIPVHWVLLQGADINFTCPNLNSGVTSVTGDGEEHFVSKIQKNKNGTGTMDVQANAHGSAVDNLGNAYSWAYVNHLSFDIKSNVGHFTDRFDLVSHGKAPNVTVYLNWDVIIDPNHDPEELPFFSTFVSGTTKGDPGCDPI